MSELPDPRRCRRTLSTLVAGSVRALSYVTSTEPMVISITRNIAWPRINALIRGFSAVHLALYKVSDGMVSGRFAGMKILLLTTKGRKSQREYSKPLGYLADGDSFLVAASDVEYDRNPDWLLNLRSNSEAEVRVRRRTIRVKAEEVNEDERARLWPAFVQHCPPYATYQRRTSRIIPIIRLRRLAP